MIVVYEDSQFMRSEDFACAVKGSDNSFLLITRNYLPNLPVSVDEIYELSGKKSKNKRFRPIGEQCLQLFHLLTICLGPSRIARMGALAHEAVPRIRPLVTQHSAYVHPAHTL